GDQKLTLDSVFGPIIASRSLTGLTLNINSLIGEGNLLQLMSVKGSVCLRRASALTRTCALHDLTDRRIAERYRVVTFLFTLWGGVEKLDKHLAQDLVGAQRLKQLRTRSPPFFGDDDRAVLTLSTSLPGRDISRRGNLVPVRETRNLRVVCLSNTLALESPLA